MADVNKDPSSTVNDPTATCGESPEAEEQGVEEGAAGGDGSEECIGYYFQCLHDRQQQTSRDTEVVSREEGRRVGLTAAD